MRCGAIASSNWRGVSAYPDMLITPCPHPLFNQNNSRTCLTSSRLFRFDCLASCFFIRNRSAYRTCSHISQHNAGVLQKERHVMIAIPRLQHIRRICIPAVWSQEKALHTLQVYHWQSCVKLSLIDFDQINAILNKLPNLGISAMDHQRQHCFQSRSLLEELSKLSITHSLKGNFLGQCFIRCYLANR